ncbi:MAG: glycosyltransferase family A protein [Tannerellaceae bacterium]
MENNTQSNCSLNNNSFQILPQESSEIEISIILPVYNVDILYFKEAVYSILEQSFDNFELLIIDDGSDIDFQLVLDLFDDERIRLIRNHHNFIDTLNRGLKESKGRYIARMDADDIMVPHRLQTQYDFMESNPEVDVCGSWAESFGKT